MKKATSIICLVFVLIMALSLPISAATPYYTYTYSIDGLDLRSPDAYVPDREVNSDYMGLTDVNKLAEIYPDRTPLMGYYDEENPEVCDWRSSGLLSMGSTALSTAGTESTIIRENPSPPTTCGAGTVSMRRFSTPNTVAK